MTVEKYSTNDILRQIRDGGGGGGPVTIADGADVTQGALADAAVAAGAAGSTSAKLRRLTTDTGAILAKLPASLGAKTGATSFSIVPASDGFAVTITSGSVAATQSGAWNVTNISGTISLPTGAATETSAAAAATSLAVIDDWDESDRAKVNLIAGVAGITAGAGAVAAGTPRVTLASDDPLVAKLPALGPKASSGSVSVANSFLTAAALGDGSVNTAESITVVNTVQLVEFFNISANVIWASWTGTAAASTTGSFPIPALASGVAGYYSAPPGASGSLSIIAVGGASAFTCIGWS